MCKRESASSCLSFPLFVHFSFSPIKFLSQISRLLWDPKSSNFVYTLRVAKYVVGKKIKMLSLIFAFFFHFSFFPSLHSNIIYSEICVKDISGTTAPRILKFGTNVVYDLLYYVRENQPPADYHFLYLSSFLSLQSNFLLQISQLLWEPVFKFLMHLESGQVYCGTENQDAEIYFYLLFPFFLFSIFHSNVIQCNT